MAYANGFDGDVAQLDYILKTIDEKNLAIPGVTCSSELTLNVSGDTAYYYERGASTVSEGLIGAKVDPASSGVTRKALTITNALHFNDVIPTVNYATVKADVVADKLVNETIIMTNTYSDKFIAALEASTGTVTGTTALTKDNVYDTIVDAKKEFELAHKAANSKLSPKTLIVGPTVEALLLKSPEYQRSTASGDATIENGVIGSISGLTVVKAISLDEDTGKVDFIIMHPSGAAAVTNLRNIKAYDANPATGYVGLGVFGELGYANKVIKDDLVLVRKHA